MNYIELNDNNRKRIKNICSPEYVMNWEDPEALDILAGDLPEIRATLYDDDIRSELEDLKKLYSSFEPINTDKEYFIKEVETKISNIKAKKQYWYGIDKYQVEKSICMQKACVMSGTGGAGKTFFVMKLEEELTKRGVPHLCIYGKFEKEISRVDIEEIKDLSNDKRFVFIIDALNEMKCQAQIDLCKTIKALIRCRGLQILITYRDKTINSAVYDLLKDISHYDYHFEGVSYESAIENMLKAGIPDVYKYQDILLSNNALLLTNLMDVLDNKAVLSGTNSICSITTILENGGIKTRAGLEAWTQTKTIATWMLDHEKTEVTLKELSTIIGDSETYISKMEQRGYLSIFYYKEIPYIMFSSETMMNYLMARSMLGRISQMSSEEIPEYITRKTETIPGIEEAVIIALFDKYKNKYQELKKLLIETNLIEELSPSNIQKISFDQNSIELFSRTFKTDMQERWLLFIAGYVDKPFNCTNYLNNIFLNNKEAQVGITDLLAGDWIVGNVSGRLKNLIYFTTINGVNNKGIEEALFFAVWCTAAPSRTIRHLAMKLLFDIASRNDRCRHLLIETLPKIVDPYIIEAIVYALAYCDPGINKETKNCFSVLIADQDFHYARSIKRIAMYMGDSHNYINWEKTNLYRKEAIKPASEAFQNLLGTVDLMDKYLLPFRFWSVNDFRDRDSFLDAPKQAVEALNNDLNSNYECLRDHYECLSSSCLKDSLLDKHGLDADLRLSKTNLASCYEKAAEIVFSIYQENLHDNNRRIGSNFVNSKLRKLVDISTDYFMGSIMCNYYRNEFINYDGADKWGFDVYDPIRFSDSEEINLTTPITTFNDVIEQMGFKLIERIEVPVVKDNHWHDDTVISERNLLNLINPIEVFDDKWVLLAGRFNFYEKKKNETLWRDTYNIYCCTSDERRIKGTGDRYLTIEVSDYTGSLRYYSSCSESPECCKNMRRITLSDEFEDSTLLLPPADLIKFFTLSPDYRDMSWRDRNGKAVIMCDNCRKSYYRDFATSLILIREESLKEYLKKGTIKHFAFSERYLADNGFSHESWYHYEIQEGTIIRKYSNNQPEYDNYGREESIEECIHCPHNLYSKLVARREKNAKAQDEFLQMIKTYAMDDWNE